MSVAPSSTRRDRPRPRLLTDDSDRLELAADVLVVGGGPAATWSAVAAAEQGASVVLVDKGYCGTSGVAATAGVNHWLVPPDPDRRDEEISPREARGGMITDRAWIDATLDTAWHRTALLPDWGWNRLRRGRSAPPSLSTGTGTGTGTERSFSGPAPDYLRFLRGRVRKSGAMILDHSPALELLRDPSGAVAGARGHQRQRGRPWWVSAGAVVLATGGTTWQSHSLGGDVNTGDGQLMAVEVGAHLSSMEFSNFYGMAPLGTSMDKNGYFIQASYWEHDGTPIEHGDLHASRLELLVASTRGTITAQFTQFPPSTWPNLRERMPNFFMVTDKLGVDPFTERFPIDWVNEGTVRGTGGLHLVDRTGSVGVPGLFAAGDVAARDRIVGSATGAGGPNLAWAIASGTWSGQSAAHHARQAPPRSIDSLAPSGTVGVHHGHHRDPTPSTTWPVLRAVVRDELLPVENSVLRSDRGLRRSLTRLDDTWNVARDLGVPADGSEIKSREVAAMIAMARWANHSALARTESRGMHTRTDHPDEDPSQRHRLLSGGLERVWVEVDPVSPAVGRDRIGPTKEVAS